MNIGHHHRRPRGGPSLRTTERTRAQRGYVLVMFALLLVPLLLLTGFAVDVGSWYSKTSDMRRAADAAALAGVVWLPDEAKARQVALDTAAKNGFTPNSHVSITVTPSTQADNRLKVKIADDRVGSFFYEALGGREIPLSRTSFAEYILRVPLGSPRNYFGLGVLTTGFTKEFLYNSVNPYCTDKVNGDQYQSGYSGGTCSGNRNDEYDPKGYEFYIEAVEGRSSDIEVRLYDPRYNEDAVPNDTVTGQTCSYPWPSPPAWTQVTLNSFQNTTLNGPAQYQTYDSSRRQWSSTQTLNSGQNQTFRGPVTFRYQYPSGPQVCTPTYGTENAIDDFRQSGNDSYTFSLYAADNTPLNDNDNPLMCTKTFDHDTAFEFKYLGSMRWNKMPCDITTGMLAGRYILRVHNSGAVSNPLNDGSNQWGLVAKYKNAAGDGLCDGRTDTLCPRVYGKSAISVRAAATTSVASFYLAEIAPQHEGKTLRITLFDPGEGGSTIQIMQPSGTDGNTWTAHSFNWSSDNGSSGTNATSLDVTNSRFNGKHVTIDVKLDGYNPPSNNYWWQIKYTFSGTVTDRTTWGAEVIGDPIHLVNEYDY